MPNTDSAGVLMLCRTLCVALVSWRPTPNAHTVCTLSCWKQGDRVMAILLVGLILLVPLKSSLLFYPRSAEKQILPFMTLKLEKP